MSSLKSSAVRRGSPGVRGARGLSGSAGPRAMVAQRPLALKVASGARTTRRVSSHSCRPPPCRVGATSRLMASISIRPSFLPRSSNCSATTSSAGMLAGGWASSVWSSPALLAGMLRRARRACTLPARPPAPSLYSTRPASSRACTSARHTRPSRVPLATTSCSVRSSASNCPVRTDQTVGTKPWSGAGAGAVALAASSPNRLVSASSQASASSRGVCRRATTPLSGKASCGMACGPTPMTPRATRPEAASRSYATTSWSATSTRKRERPLPFSCALS